jgi:hypothetical protein
MAFQPPYDGVCKISSSLLIYDGLGGRKRYCGNSTFKTPIKASLGGKDLYISYKGRSKQTVCQIYCGKKTQKKSKLHFFVKIKLIFLCITGIFILFCFLISEARLLPNSKPKSTNRASCGEKEYTI